MGELVSERVRPTLGRALSLRKIVGQAYTPLNLFLLSWKRFLSKVIILQCTVIAKMALLGTSMLITTTGSSTL